MENDQGTRELPASDGPLKGFLGGARRCAERATNLSTGQSGGSPSGELGRLTKVIARLQTKSASFEGMWRRVLEFANKADTKATRQDRRVEFLLTRSIQRMLENDKLQQDQEDREGELSASRREIGALQTETNVSGTGGDSDSFDDTGSTESATEMNDTGTRTPRAADDIDVPDTSHDDLSGHMRQPEFPAAHDHSLDTQVLHWRETCAQATQGGAAF